VDYLKEIGLDLPFAKDENADRGDGRDPYQEIYNAANIKGGTTEAEEGLAVAKEWLEQGIDGDYYRDAKGSTALIKAAVYGARPWQPVGLTGYMYFAALIKAAMHGAPAYHCHPGFCHKH
jgi:hypothetical protein